MTGGGRVVDLYQTYDSTHEHSRHYTKKKKDKPSFSRSLPVNEREPKHLLIRSFGSTSLRFPVDSLQTRDPLQPSQQLAQQQRCIATNPRTKIGSTPSSNRVWKYCNHLVIITSAHHRIRQAKFEWTKENKRSKIFTKREKNKNKCRPAVGQTGLTSSPRGNGI